MVNKQNLNVDSPILILKYKTTKLKHLANLSSDLLEKHTTTSKSSNLNQFNQEDTFMTKTLELSFKSSLDKPVKLQLPQLNNIVTEQVARDSMNALVDLNILKSNSGAITKVHSAQIIDKTTTVLFEAKK